MPSPAPEATIALSAPRREMRIERSIVNWMSIVDEFEWGATYLVNETRSDFSFRFYQRLLELGEKHHISGLCISRIHPSKISAKYGLDKKNILWLRIRTIGRQAHGSLPTKGINAHRAGAQLMLRMDKELHERYKKKNEMFDVPFSTFEPTKKESNVPNINTIPGEDVFYFDCRILPDVPPSEIKQMARRLADQIEKEYDVKVEISVMQEETSPPTRGDSEIVAKLGKAIKSVRGIEPKMIGIGGGTCAAYFRQKGFNAPVWTTGDRKAHDANEYCIIDNLVKDAKVFASVFLS